MIRYDWSKMGLSAGFSWILANGVSGYPYSNFAGPFFSILIMLVGIKFWRDPKIDLDFIPYFSPNSYVWLQIIAVQMNKNI